jgi:hypothetical protein
MSYSVTGTCKTRLNELKKYTITNNFSEKYFGSGSLTSNGVDFNSSVVNVKIVYFIDGIQYFDYFNNGNYNKTNFVFSVSGDIENNISFTNTPIYKDPNKSKLISNPKVNDDVFIVRQEISAFEKNYKLEFMSNLIELETYASGKYFNLINNS